MRQSRGYRWFGTGGNSKKQRAGNRRVRETRRTLKKAELQSSLPWAMRAYPVRTTWEAYIKSPRSVHPEDRRLDHLSTVFCPHSLRVDLGVLTSPHFGAARARELSRLPGHQRKPWGREQKDTQHTHEAWHYQHKVSMNLHGTVHFNYG